MSGESSMLAAEYVLGTLSEDERLRVLVRMARDPQLRREVALWDRRLLPLADAVPTEAPPDQVWRAIERSLALARPAGAGDAAAAETLGTDAGVVPGAIRRRAAPTSWALTLWRGLAIGMTAVAAALAGVLVYDRMAGSASPATPVSGERYVAVVDRDGGQPALIVSVDTAAEQVVVRSVTAEPPSDRSYEVWFVADGDKTPRSLGTLEADADANALSRAFGTLGAEPRGTIAISEEPPGGSPTGRATGPVVFSGRLIRAD